ncbi:MAG: glycosyltransferase family 39 protein [Bacteroidota bacterium]|jgi:hypothetical protein
MTGKKKRNGAPHSPEPSHTAFTLPQFFTGERAPLFISVLYFIVMCSTAFTYHTIGDYGVETDSYWTYIPQAQNILKGVLEVDQFKGPGYEFVLAAVSSVTGELFRAGMLISLVSAAVVLYLTYKVIAKFFNPECALVVSVALATNYTFLKYSYTTGTDMFFNMLAVIVLFFLLKSTELRLWELAVAGAVTGYAYVTRYNAISFYLAAVAGLILLNYKNLPMKDRLTAAGVFILASLVFVVPWSLYCHRETGSFSYNKNYVNIAYEMYGKGKVSWDEFWWKMSGKFSSYVDVLVQNPGGFVRQILVNAGEHFWNDISSLVELPLGIFAAGGIVALIQQKVDRRQGMYFIFAAAFYLVLLPVFYGERFSLFLAPTILLLTVVFFQWRRIPAMGFARFGVKHVVLIVVMFIAGRTAIEKVASDIDSGPSEILQLRDAFFQHSAGAPEGTVIMARKPQAAYYLKMKFVPFAYVNSIGELISECRKHRVDYLFYSGIEAGLRPQFSYLLDPARAPRQLHPVVQVYNPPAVLYQMKYE